MSRGTSGRIVIEVDPDLKRTLYSNLAVRGFTLKEWFIANAESFIRDESQMQLIEKSNNMTRELRKEQHAENVNQMENNNGT